MSDGQAGDHLPAVTLQLLSVSLGGSVFPQPESWEPDAMRWRADGNENGDGSE